MQQRELWASKLAVSQAPYDIENNMQTAPRHCTARLFHQFRTKPAHGLGRCEMRLATTWHDWHANVYFCVALWLLVYSCHALGNFLPLCHPQSSLHEPIARGKRYLVTDSSVTSRLTRDQLVLILFSSSTKNWPSANRERKIHKIPRLLPGCPTVDVSFSWYYDNDIKSLQMIKVLHKFY